MRASISCIIVFLSLFFQFCHTVEKTSVSCPEFSGHKFNTTKNKIRSDNKITANHKLNLGSHLNPSKLIASRCHKKDSTLLEFFYIPDKTNYLKRLTASTINTIALQPDVCDTIFLKTGSWLKVKIARKGLSRISYLDCNNLTGHLVSISKTEIRSISFSNENQRHIQGGKSIKRKSDPIGIIAIIFSIAGLLFLGSLSFPFISLILSGGILGWISANRIKMHPDKLKGRTLAEFSIVLAYALLIFLVLFLVVVLIGKIV